MPYTIRKYKNGYRVCKKNEPSKCFSKKPLTKEKAERQMRAILMNEHKEGGAIPENPELYEEVKEKIYAKIPKHSAYRSMILTKAYKKAGGTYKEDNKEGMNTTKWLGQKWTSVNDYYHNGEVVECGNTDTQKKFGEYPLCRPLAIIEKLSKEDMKKMIDEKNKLGEKPLITEKVLDTDEFNIKDSVSGGLKPLTARIGGKVLLKKVLVNEYFPDPESYTTYVEPFVGGGAVYFYKNKDGKKEVVNDIDPDIYTIFKGFQKYEGKKLAEDLNGDYTPEDFRKIKASQPTSEYNKFLKTYLLYRLSYFGRGKSFGKTRISSSFDGYKDRLYDVDILKSDYKDVISKYNTPSTFFYLDPPAVPSTGNYSFSAISAQELVPILKTIKGKFCLSFANTSIKKELFKDFNIYTVSTMYVGEKSKGGQSKKTNEYVITNYVPPNIGRKTGSGLERPIGGCATCHLRGFGAPDLEKVVEPEPKKCGGCMGACGGSMVKFHKQLSEVGLTHDKYMAKAKELAKSQGYDPSKIEMSEDEDHKLVYHSPEGDRYFGKVSYSDYIIWSWLEHKGEVPEGTAEKRRMAYRARATKIKGNWKDDKYSPNNLAINILW